MASIGVATILAQAPRCLAGDRVCDASGPRDRSPLKNMSAGSRVVPLFASRSVVAGQPGRSRQFHPTRPLR